MLTTLVNPLCSSEDGSAFFQRSVKIPIIIYPCLRRELHAGYLKFMWRECARSNYFVAMLIKIILLYQGQNGSFKCQNGSFKSRKSSFNNHQILKYAIMNDTI